MQNFGRENAHALLGAWKPGSLTLTKFIAKQLSPPQRPPARHPNKNSNNQKIESARGTMGRGKRRELLFSFSPSNRAQRALFFFLPQPPYNAKRPLRGREAKQRNLKQSVSQPCFHIRSDVVYMIG